MAGITSKVEEVGCWHCRRYFMNPNNWNPGEQPDYPKQWDIDWLEKKIIRELKRLPVADYLVMVTKLTGQDLALIKEMSPTDEDKFLTYCLLRAEKERAQEVKARR